MAGDSAVLYLAEVTRKQVCIQFQCEKRFEVENRKPLAVTIYDYYMPSELMAEEGKDKGDGSDILYSTAASVGSYCVYIQ